MSFLDKLKKGMQNDGKASALSDPEAEEKDEETGDETEEAEEAKEETEKNDKDVREENETEEIEEEPAAETGNEKETETEEEKEKKPEEKKKTTGPKPSVKPDKETKKKAAPKILKKVDSQLENLKIENLTVKEIPMVEDQQEEKNEKEQEWLEPEGQLAVDVYQTEGELVIQAAIAGIKTEDLDVLIEEDVLTIKGKRNNPIQAAAADYFIQECYWGSFSRKIILPVEVDASRTDAAMKEGILTISIPKIQREKKKKVTIKG